jgi:adenylosuccinate lyase
MTGTSDDRSLYSSPLAARYASRAMLEVFSERRKIRTWRLLWTALADAQRELGLAVTQEQVDAMRAAVDAIDFEKAAAEERRIRHDVMAHIRTFAAACPAAGGVIHLGATSCFVADNTDLIVMRDACRIVQAGLVNTIAALSRFAEEHKSLPTQAYTHFQPAQLTTVGKRACLWIQDLVMDLEDLERFINHLGFRGVKGTTGTQASFLKLFDGDHGKVKKLDELVTAKMGFTHAFPVTGQTYPRKVDAKLLAILAGIAASAHKFSVDLRLLSHERELEEPFEKDQVGSSAMAYKRNPMRSERITSLARYVMTLASNPLHTAANQWLERTLDDSAGKRVVVPEAFLAVDSVLTLCRNVAAGLIVNPAVIRANLDEELDAMATENILMAAVQAGGDRQELHERIRKHSMEAARRRKETGAKSDLMERLRKDEAFAKVVGKIDSFRDPALFTGRSAEQVDEFLQDHVALLLHKRSDLLDEGGAEVRV